jgi:hypothetical protein
MNQNRNCNAFDFVRDRVEVAQAGRRSCRSKKVVGAARPIFQYIPLDPTLHSTPRSNFDIFLTTLSRCQISVKRLPSARSRQVSRSPRPRWQHPMPRFSITLMPLTTSQTYTRAKTYRHQIVSQTPHLPVRPLRS